MMTMRMSAKLPVGAGYAIVVTALDLQDAARRICETFVFVLKYPNKMVHYEAMRWFYDGIPVELYPNEHIWDNSKGYGEAVVSGFAFETREDLGLSAITGYGVELEEAHPDTLALLSFSEAGKEKYLKMGNVTTCAELGEWFDSHAVRRWGNLSEQDLTDK